MKVVVVGTCDWLATTNVVFVRDFNHFRACTNVLAIYRWKEWPQPKMAVNRALSGSDPSCPTQLICLAWPELSFLSALQ